MTYDTAGVMSTVDLTVVYAVGNECVEVLLRRSNDTCGIVAVAACGDVAVVSATLEGYGVAGLAVSVVAVDVTCNTCSLTNCGSDLALVYAVLEYERALACVSEHTASLVLTGGDLSGVGATCEGVDGSVCTANDTCAVCARAGLGDRAVVYTVLKGNGSSGLYPTCDTADLVEACDSAVVYAVDELDVNAFALNLTDHCAGAVVACEVADSGNGSIVNDVLEENFGTAVYTASNRAACAVSVEENDLCICCERGYGALNGEVLDGSAEVEEHRLGDGYGLAVAVECAYEGLSVGLSDGDVVCKVVCAVGLHSCKACGIGDRGSFGSSGYREGAKTENHAKSENDGKCLFHDKIPF